MVVLVDSCHNNVTVNAIQWTGPCIPKGWGIILAAQVMGLNTIEATGRLKGIVSTIITSARLILIH